ncbi:protein of unknown function [Filimonas lacunae]|uniref:Protein-glutamine gamma-glutamyltransferase-like C-terminal domain-containing protein n=1 Tax=Filimonas lacunae TaxID=477680 RepID=A0A173MF01_9BACT|nr:DUF4129 domain-containing protein [Filimonas lacunae]BAV06076.1 hypothetical protein FLA_2091 [Filimonas lacunae]SIT24553.1 protein of unknown function [Filimonas lacunae]
MRHTLVRFVWLLVCLMGSRAMAQDSGSQTVVDEEVAAPAAEEKHIYDSSERYFNQWSVESWKANPLLWPANNADKQVKQWRSEEDYWYVNKAQDFNHFLDSMVKTNKKKKVKSRISPDEVIDRTFQVPTIAGGSLTFAMVIVIVFVVLLGYFMYANKIGFFAPKNALVEGEGAGEEQEDLFSIQFKERLQKALQESNYRLAVRIWFLQTLRKLSDSDLIRYQPDYTNIDYLLQVQSNAPGDRSRLFSLVTSHYEYVWYGKFEVSKELYERISQDFITLQSKIG